MAVSEKGVFFRREEFMSSFHFGSVIRRLAVLAVLSSSAVAPASRAADFAYDFVACTFGRGLPLEANAEVVATGGESWGVVASSTTKEWENATTRCVGYMHVVGGKPLGRGVCKWVHTTGDTAVGEYEYSATAASRFTWLAGTGRLKGISGGGTFKTVFNGKPVDAGTAQGCRRDWGTYTLP